MKHTGSGKKNIKSKGSSIKGKLTIPKLNSPTLKYVVCVQDGGYVDLEPWKVYRVKSDTTARSQGLLRVIDGSGDDYLFPAEYVRPINAPTRLHQMIQAHSFKRSSSKRE